ncbi:hypothetical protein CEXT_780781 [Caerostris extrusa]|uniref:Uncharacterized protein n=1 Tax=Caerostris extrusa TaxID=172846 RepID=A0AAV4XB25_CAEEX|nr:hypothetical protein CEXT_780781 [Caerostris extrusa]
MDTQKISLDDPAEIKPFRKSGNYKFFPICNSCNLAAFDGDCKQIKYSTEEKALVDHLYELLVYANSHTEIAIFPRNFITETDFNSHVYGNCDLSLGNLCRHAILTGLIRSKNG